MRPPTSLAIIFDLGGVLIRWNPRFLYRKLFNGDEQAMEDFLDTVCTSTWNEQQDLGRRFQDGADQLIALYPDKADHIRAFGERFDEMIPGALEDVVEIVDELRRQGTPLYALTNWSAETFPSQRGRFPFLSWFDGIVVSGDEKLIKPDPAIFRLLLDRYGLEAKNAVFIDDSLVNVRSAASVGLRAIHFTSANALRVELESLGVLATDRTASTAPGKERRDRSDP